MNEQGVIAAGMCMVLGSAGLSLVLGAAVRELAPRLGLVDHPSGRKAHRRPTPLGGGVAIWLSVLVVMVAGAAIACTRPAWLPPEVRTHIGGIRARLPELAGILMLASLIMFMGLADDKKALSWKPRLAIQILLATVYVAIWGGVTLFFPSVWIFRLLGGIVAVGWIVAMTNAFNFLDNMDGLAASVGLIAAALFAGAQTAVGGLFVPAVLGVLAGALVGFLWHNWTPARLFMGDAGSNFIGFLLGVLTVAGTFSRPYEKGSSPLGVLAPLLVMAVPLYDMGSVILIRLREGRSPFQADRRHFSHRLVERGLTPPAAVATIDLVTLAGGLGALLLHRLDARGALIVAAQTLCVLGVVAVLEASPGRPAPAPPPSSRDSTDAQPHAANEPAPLGSEPAP